MMSRARRIAQGFVAAAAAAAAVVALAGASAPVVAAPDRGNAQRELGVATYNVYLGADLTPLFAARNLQEFVAAAGGVYAQMEHTDFPRRAEAIADQIAEHEPEVVGLQEVALWQRGPLGGQLSTTYDFLPILRDALAERGLDYDPVATNVDFGTPQPVPISATEQASFLDRDVILARSDLPASALKVSNPQSALFDASLTLPSAIGPIAVPRGYSTVDVKVRGTWVRVANTHLEAFGGRSIRELQGRELIAALAGSPYPVIVLGDLNTCPENTGSVHPRRHLRGLRRGGVHRRVGRAPRHHGWPDLGPECNARRSERDHPPDRLRHAPGSRRERGRRRGHRRGGGRPHRRDA